MKGKDEGDRPIWLGEKAKDEKKIRTSNGSKIIIKIRFYYLWN